MLVLVGAGGVALALVVVAMLVIVRGDGDRHPGTSPSTATPRSGVAVVMPTSLKRGQMFDVALEVPQKPAHLTLAPTLELRDSTGASVNALIGAFGGRGPSWDRFPVDVPDIALTGNGPFIFTLPDQLADGAYEICGSLTFSHDLATEKLRTEQFCRDVTVSA